MATKWVVVAESSRARIFAFLQAGLAMEELEGLTHPASRAHERDLISDRPGRSSIALAAAGMPWKRR
jgi:protein required for attachment to host cells